MASFNSHLKRLHSALLHAAWSPWLGYTVALALPLATVLSGARVGMPPFVFDYLVVLFVVGVAMVWGMAPAITAAVTAAVGGNIFLREPTGIPTIAGVPDVLELAMFVGVAAIVGWLVTSARRERARAEAAAVREREAREDRERLISTITHDLATPLGVIRGNIQLARRAASADAFDLERLLRRLDTAAARAISLMRTLRDARTLDSGTLSLDLYEIDIRDLVTAVVQMMDQFSERHPVVLALPKAPVIVACDAERLQRVVENLVTNAMKYSPDGGAIEVTLSTDGRQAAVAVRDHGIGISAEALPRVFERGFRAPEAVATAPGLGLGLSISAEIVKRHGGTIEARRGEPAGSILTVRLPLARLAPPPPLSRGGPEAARSGNLHFAS